MKNLSSQVISGSVVQVSQQGTQLKEMSVENIAGGGSNTIGVSGNWSVDVHQPVQVFWKILNDQEPANNTSQSQWSQKGSGAQLTIQPDEYASEIFWEVWDVQTNALMVEGGDYRDGQLAKIQESICLPAGCYELVVYDYYGDGICCEWGNGWIKLVDSQGKQLAQSNGRYGDYFAKSFCTGSNDSRVPANQSEIWNERLRNLQANREYKIKAKGLKG